MDQQTDATAEAKRTRLFRSSNSRRPRRLMTLVATIALVFGGNLMVASAAHADPGDPVVFVDQNLEDAINDVLGQSPGDTITEAQAAGITTLDAPSAGITDLSGIEFLTGLIDLRLNHNNVTDLSPLSALTNLDTFYAINNNISDISALSGLTSLTRLYLSSNSITDISVLSGLENLTNLYAANNSISNIAVVSDLEDLTNLLLGNNHITDITPVSGLADLTILHVENNSISDISALAGKTSLTNVWLQENNITDISPLSAMTNLLSLRVEDQSVNLPAAVTGAPTANPVVDLSGTQVPVSSSDSGFAYDSTAHEWIFTVSGAKSLTWNTTVDAGSVTDAEFSGVITQNIGQAPLVPVAAQDPEVIQATCVDGDVVGPQIALPSTDGLDYVIEGNVAPGSTVTVRAIPADDNHFVAVNPNSDWVGNSDGLFATLDIVLDPIDCAAASAADDAQEESTFASLQRTGGSPATSLFGTLGVLAAVMGVGVIAVRRRNLV